MGCRKIPWHGDALPNGYDIRSMPVPSGKSNQRHPFRK
jgi:hypothetical protein